MGATADAVLAAGGQVTGVIPRFMVEQGWHHGGLTELIEVDDMHSRKQKMARLSDAVIALPGGCGTLGGTAGNHHLETAGTLPQPHRHTERERILHPPARHVASRHGRKLHAAATRRHLVRGADPAGSHPPDIPHPPLGQFRT